MDTKKYTPNPLRLLVAASTISLLAACSDDDSPSPSSDVDVADTGDAGMGDADMGDANMGDANMGDTDMDATTPGTIPEVAAAAGSFTTLLSAVTDAGLADDLSGEGPFTVFAPTDDAFAALPDGTLEGLTTEQLTDILLYHVIGEELFAADVLADADGMFTTLLGVDVEVTTEGDDVFIGGARIAMTDIEASNGVIHVIESVILPPEEGPGTIPEVAAEAGSFATLLSAVTDAGLADDLSGEGPFTVFAPTDAAFDALPEGTLESLTTEQLTDILLYHVVGEELFAADVLADEDGMLTTLLGEDVEVTTEGEDVFIGGARIAMTNIEASNGVIHVIESVILPPEGPGTIPEVAAEAGSFSTLLSAVTDAGLADDLSGEGPFTVFAPTDAAFDALPEGTLESLTIEQLTDILLYHVVAENLVADDVLGSSLLTSLLGPFIKVDADAVTVAGSPISMTNIEASNGTIHVIDAVMLPPGDIPTIATDAGVFTTLVSALSDAGLVDDLQAEGPFTVFAPTDAAFDALPEGTLESLTTEQLTDILLYHVVSGTYPASAVADGVELTMLNGDVATLSLTGGAAIEGAAISSTDIPASNGLVHVIDAVILPPSD